MNNIAQTAIIRIAIAEEHTLVRTGIVSVIQSNPLFKVVIQASNGKELINNINALSSPPDVCIVGISMPVMNGFDTVAALKKQFPHIKCLVLTVFDHEYSIIKMIRNGANGYLLKTCTGDELLKAIEKIFNEDYYYSATASRKSFAVVKNNHLPDLTEKEIEFLKYCCTSLTFDKIAEKMHISYHTACDYQKKVGDKLNLHGRIALAFFAITSGIVPVNYHTYPESEGN